MYLFNNLHWLWK